MPETVTSGTAGIRLPPGPAAAAAEEAARLRATAAAGDVAAPPADVPDLGGGTREAGLRRALPVLAAVAAAGILVAALRRRGT
jgi:hypothetical protein